jgi:hypothetical protein
LDFKISQQVLPTTATPTPQSVWMAWRVAVIRTERGTDTECYCVARVWGGQYIEELILNVTVFVVRVWGGQYRDIMEDNDELWS